MPPPVTRSFANVISGTGFKVEAPDPEPYVHMNMLSAIDRPESGDGCATDDTGGEGVAPTQPPTRLGCGAPVTGLGRSFITSSLVCTRFVMCATAAPLTASGVGGAGAHVCTAPTVGGAGWAAPAAAMPAALPPAGSPDEWDPSEELSPDAIPPRRHGRHRARQGFWLAPWAGYIPTHPPPPPLSDAPPSPDYSPGPTTDEEEGEEPSSLNMPISATPAICSRNDSPPAPETDMLFTVTLLRVGRAVQETSSG
ncbi:hypothetical protein CYMTET_11411 [Cymbomonas tetramitiformis]|uniref:Uncharacterized protein n=1 Tax=Cymbomonas tetramitiformis TaxID=36881 RepID=A0AAE0GMI7_9CHLO|nr:hypothetical protein CYMTET_11411 [Cymbomonas tetramitiformis]